MTDKKKTYPFGLNRSLFIALTCSCVAVIFIFAAVITVLKLSGKGAGKSDVSPLDGEEIRGVWIASVSNIDFPSAADLDAQTLRQELDNIVNVCAETGLNTIFFQVRPASDALYDSDIFPVSRWMSTDGQLTLDALQYLIDEAHSRGIAVHAWVNPLRVSASASLSVEDLPESSPAKQHPDWCVKYADGRYYYDCGIPEVRELVADGVREIVEKYDVDGIVFDDYFYPYPKTVTSDDGTSTVAEFEDSSTFSTYGEGYEDIGDWRRDNVNKMVALVSEAARGHDRLFGIAPFGIWKNGYGDESGSETRGAQSYYDIYCDTLAWIKSGTVDYVAPQLYWRTSDTAAPYNVLCDWWQNRVEGTGVRLLICHGAYRYDSDWPDPSGIITSQVEYARQKSCYRGSVLYGFEEIRDNTEGLGDEVRDLYLNSANEDK